MKTNSTYLVLITLCYFLTNSLSAQTLTGKSASALIPGTEMVRIDERRMTPSFVKPGATLAIANGKHLQWISEAVLHLHSDDALRLSNQKTDKAGFIHYRYKQFYRNLPVEYGVYYAHIENGLLQSVNGEFYKGISINAQPAMRKDQAFQKAVTASGGTVFKGGNNRPAP